MRAATRAIGVSLALGLATACAPSLDDRTGGMSVAEYDRMTEAGGAVAAGEAPLDLNNPGLSDEQSFEAVTERETIESDQARLEAQQRAYRTIEPTPVGPRPSESGPNIVAYALQTSNAVGERLYRRFNPLGGGSGRNCGNYASADMAQMAFLEAGGPERDSENLDPDGDGFACSWSPAPYRDAVR